MCSFLSADVFPGDEIEVLRFEDVLDLCVGLFGLCLPAEESGKRLLDLLRSLRRHPVLDRRCKLIQRLNVAACHALRQVRLCKSVLAQEAENCACRQFLPRRRGVANRLEDLNTVIGKYSIGWDISRISRLARTIMQLAIYEILYVEDVPTGVAVSEAVRLAKKYDGNDTGAFVNGILGSFARELAAEEVK